MLGKKGIGMGSSGRQGISLVLGFTMLFLGAVPLLFKFGVIPFDIPPLPGLVISVLATAGGLVLLWDALIENMPTGIESQIRIASLVLGLAVLVVGLIPLLHAGGWIEFEIPEFADNVIHGVFVIVGVLLVYGASKQF